MRGRSRPTAGRRSMGSPVAPPTPPRGQKSILAMGIHFISLVIVFVGLFCFSSPPFLLFPSVLHAPMAILSHLLLRKRVDYRTGPSEVEMAFHSLRLPVGFSISFPEGAADYLTWLCNLPGPPGVRKCRPVALRSPGLLTVSVA